MIRVLVILIPILLSLAYGFIHPQGPGCGAILTGGLVNYTIKGTVNASNSSLDTSHAVLNNSGAWCSKRPTSTANQLIITLGRQVNVSGVAIQGRHGYDQYLTKFKISFKKDENSAPKFFPSNINGKEFMTTPSNGDEIVEVFLNRTAMTTLIFVPLSWNDLICLRVEVYGCVQVDGIFSPWSEWSGCSSSCGNGTQVWGRSCTNPAPANGGSECEGPLYDTRHCTGSYCPVDGGFRNWEEWSPCSSTCGPGYQLRTRQCLDPVPAHGGRDCHGNTGEARACSLSRCEENADTQVRSSSSCKERQNTYFITMLILVGALFILVTLLVAFLVLKHRSRSSIGLPLQDAPCSAENTDCHHTACVTGLPSVDCKETVLDNEITSNVSFE